MSTQEKRTTKNASYLTATLIVAVIIGSVMYFAPSWKNKNGSANGHANKLYNPDYATESNNSPTKNNAPTKNNSEPEIGDISSYITEHTFSINGDGNISFVAGAVIIKSRRATLQGEYEIIGARSARLSNIQATDGNFDPSNNGNSYGMLGLNSDGTLNMSLSDGKSGAHEYRLSPNN